MRIIVDIDGTVALKHPDRDIYDLARVHMDGASSAANVPESRSELLGAPRASQGASWGLTGHAHTEQRASNYAEGIR